MKHKISIVLVEEHINVNIYSVVIDNKSDTEFIAFLNSLITQKKQEDAKQIVNQLTKIGENGAYERYFRYEGKMTDRVCALPGHYMVESNCRLYCLRFTDSLIIIGNGGIKATKTYQEDTYLNNCVAILQEIDKKINNMIKSGDIKIDGKTILGKLDFLININ